MSAHYGRAMTLLAAKRHSEAIEHFRRALDLYPDHAQSHLGLSIALDRTGTSSAAQAASRRAEEALAVLDRARPIEAGVVRAELMATRGRLSEAGSALDALVAAAPPGFACWVLPVEPLLSEFSTSEAFAGARKRLAERAI